MSDTIRLLYVDDDEDMRRLMEAVLEIDGGFDARICESGPQALELLDEFDPQLMLFDVLMPVMDGPELLSVVRERGSQAPVAFISAQSDIDELQRLMALGSAGTIKKPFDIKTLATEIRALLV
jgi:DNA-binding response OmpR family regulator